MVGQKGAVMDGMTDYQFESAIKMIIEIIESSKTKEEAIEKIKKLLDK